MSQNRYNLDTHKMWKNVPIKILSQIKTLISKIESPVIMFFRADDIGTPCRYQTKLLELFIKHEIPLCVAMIPTQMTPVIWDCIKEVCENKLDLFCWHQHGYEHINHNGTTGKKYEFGKSRTFIEKYQDITKGQIRLKIILEDRLFPAFTPPWNIADVETLEILKLQNFKVISRSSSASIAIPMQLKELSINIDLHTRKEDTVEEAWENLITEFTYAFQTKQCGIMIHHTKMNESALIFLDFFLTTIKENTLIKVITFKDIVK